MSEQSEQSEHELDIPEPGSARDMPGGRAGEPGYVMPLLEQDALTRVVHVWAEPEHQAGG